MTPIKQNAPTPSARRPAPMTHPLVRAFFDLPAADRAIAEATAGAGLDVEEWERRIAPLLDVLATALDRMGFELRFAQVISPPLAALRAAAATSDVADVYKDFPVKLIQRRVCEYFGLTLSDMIGDRRSKVCAYPRHIAIFLVKTLTPHSLPSIGRYFGGRDHTTVMYAVKSAQKMLVEGGALATAIEKLRGELTVELKVHRPVDIAAAVAAEDITASLVQAITHAARKSPRQLLDALSKIALAGMVCAAALAAAPAQAGGKDDALCFTGREDVIREYRRAGHLRIFEGLSRSGRIVDVLRSRDGVFTVLLMGPDTGTCIVEHGQNSVIFPFTPDGPLPHPVPDERRKP